LRSENQKIPSLPNVAEAAPIEAPNGYCPDCFVLRQSRYPFATVDRPEERRVIQWTNNATTRICVAFAYSNKQRLGLPQKFIHGSRMRTVCRDKDLTEKLARNDRVNAARGKDFKNELADR
jgi:hypothetical protein